MKIALISDIHSNNLALEATIAQVEKAGVDKVVFLGDLLTYGCAVDSTIESILNYSNKKDITFIKGNHDQIYFDMQAGRDFQYKPFPDFILESALYTGEKLTTNLVDLFDWQEEVVVENILYTHANALGYGNWSYLNKDEEVLQTANKLIEKNIIGGFFGHTHRPKLNVCDSLAVKSNIILSSQKSNVNLVSEQCFIANPGSVGQPRGMKPSILIFDVLSEEYSFELIEVEYDVEAHISEINSSTLSMKTKQKLISYYQI